MSDLVLVAGATGQLGSAVVRKLTARGTRVRALVRTPGRFAGSGIEEAVGDLTDPDSLGSACEGVRTIVATANAAVPSRKADSFEAVERRGYRNLIEAAERAGVHRFVFTSVPVTRRPAQGLFLYKRETEELLARSELDVVVFRAAVFMDVAFAMMGSSLPVRGAEGATVRRPFQFAAGHFAKIQDSIEREHVALVPGNGDVRHSFICVDDVASFLAAAAQRGPSGVHAIGGPEALTFLDVVRLYEQVLGHPLRVKKTPALVFRVLSLVMKPFSPAAANLMWLNYLSATEETVIESAAISRMFDVRLTSAAEFLRGKAAARGMEQ